MSSWHHMTSSSVHHPNFSLSSPCFSGCQGVTSYFPSKLRSWKLSLQYLLLFHLPLKNHLKLAIQTTYRNIMSTKFAWRSKYLSWLNTHTSASKSNGQFTAWIFICEGWHALLWPKITHEATNEVSPCFWAATTAKAVQQADSKQITEVRLPPRYIKASQLIHSDWLYLVNSIRWGS